jgi:glycosyltransferase involved in cell wall biosynthesis
MNVLLVTPSYEPIVGGTETFVLQLATNLNAQGFHTDVLTLNMNRKWKPIWRKSITKKGFTIYRVPAVANPLAFLPIDPINLILKVNFFPKLSFLKILDAYNIVHFCDEVDLSFPFFSVLIKKPKIMHSLTPMAFEAIRRNFFQRTVFKRIAQIYIPCSYQIPSYLEMGIPLTQIADKKSVGVNVKNFRPDENKREDSLLLFVGRLQKLKGVHILLKALSGIKSSVHLVIIGPFDQNDPEYSNELKRMVELINTQGKHRIDLLGRKGEKELVLWYQKATFLVAPHLDQICGGLTTLEALSCATPIIATGNEVVKDKVSGLIIPPNNVEKLTNAINELLENKELRLKLGLEGRRIIEKEYSWEKIIEDLIQIYNKLIFKTPSIKV